METTTTRAMRATYDLRDLMDEHLAISHLVTRETGRDIRESIEARLEREPEGAVIALDFSHVGIIDFSCADEIISKLVARLQGLEYGDKYLILHGLTPTHEENITVALERKKLAVLVSRADGSWRLLGSLNPYLNEALQFVMNQKEITARDLADETRVEISLASTKLLNLFKARLVQRSSERLPDGGRQFIYRSLFVER
ncbi:MAG TPA: hypothetical protein VGC99_20645 [Candidatus Tectomicrobia bacterium]|jgi:hypothetical protein